MNGEAYCKAKGGLNNANEGNWDSRIKRGYQQNGADARQRQATVGKNDGKPESRDEKKRDIIPAPSATTDAQDSCHSDNL